MTNSIALVINTYQQAHFLAASIESGLAQTVPFDEIIVVDDGSTDDPASVVAGYPDVRLVTQRNAGLAAARNTGLKASSSSYIVFLDADDLLMPNAVRAGLACHALSPRTGLVYGAHRRVGPQGEPLGGDVYSDIGLDAFRTFLMGNAIGMHATVIYDRQKLCDIGAFDASLPRCEDYDVYFRMAAKHPIRSHPDVVALYRWHGQNMSADPSVMLKWVLRINDRQRARTADTSLLEDERLLGRRVWVRYYKDEIVSDLRSGWRWKTALRSVARSLRFAKIAVLEVGRWLIHRLGRAYGGRTTSPSLN
ncbi:glycosyltransferase [Bradyrhizobium sp. CCGUVB23]|uniref:glycosyltransferase n=1 Tax=Bradyrhizobium sp. CCGUVB23 TaxID=2949630 RepID=UPI0020B4293C|nr:glycosyltransferase [Bradyrhizobium sp. CCGUVB23]MCP3460043.1 glycosyltransferase [Bradyrhizobium sp. CCGUVB23]